jgi:hypothetical protein
MFEVKIEDKIYRFRFQKIPKDYKINDDTAFLKTGIIKTDRPSNRYDTVCLAYQDNEFWVWTIAFLHPNDRPDKLIGKKVALTKLLKLFFPIKSDKQTRALIWKAFWKWIEGWKENSK